MFLGVADEKVYQGLQTTERSVAELSKGLGEPVQDLIEGAEDPQLEKKGRRIRAMSEAFRLQGGCHGVKERPVPGGPRGQNWEQVARGMLWFTNCVPEMPGG